MVLLMALQTDIKHALTHVCSLHQTVVVLILFLARDNTSDHCFSSAFCVVNHGVPPKTHEEVELILEDR